MSGAIQAEEHVSRRHTRHTRRMKIWNARESGNEDIQLLPIIAVDHQPKVSVINTSSHTVKILSIFKVLLDGKWKKEDSDRKNFSIQIWPVLMIVTFY